ncbi:MAG: hypothetical protein CSA55_04425 [Ilumatobacter coccineus]|uniref:Uncharacterized protein n=1 Tax=Ilumatobacter coccineus TaxID=467094 RepID=A0A2G6K8L7_9ACTN|nr:MAG: hypothetical protein CSA55_04425 [Ilumatobacter coccineus]
MPMVVAGLAAVVAGLAAVVAGVAALVAGVASVVAGVAALVGEGTLVADKLVELSDVDVGGVAVSRVQPPMVIRATTPTRASGRSEEVIRVVLSRVGWHQLPNPYEKSLPGRSITVTQLSALPIGEVDVNRSEINPHLSTMNSQPSDGKRLIG